MLIALRLIGLEDVVMRFVRPPPIDIYLVEEEPVEPTRKLYGLDTERGIGEWRLDEARQAGQLVHRKPSDVEGVQWTIHAVSTPDDLAGQIETTPCSKIEAQKLELNPSLVWSSTHWLK